MMKPINLLPREPLIQRVFKPLAAGVLAAMAAVCAGIFALAVNFDARTRTLEAQIRWIDAKIEELAARRAPDPFYNEYMAYYEMVTGLEQARRDWEPLLAAVTGSLPAGSRITSIAAEADVLTIAAEFMDWSDIADYAIRLRSSKMVEEVAFTSIVRGTREFAEASGAVSLETGNPITIPFYSVVLNVAVDVIPKTSRENER